MTHAKDHLHKAANHHAKGRDLVRQAAAAAAAEQEMQMLQERDVTAARLAGTTKEG